MGRYFIAAVPQDLDQLAELRALLSKMKRTLADRESKVRWVPSHLWHVTLCFLGELSSSQVPDLDRQLSELRPLPTELKLDLYGVGAFPDVHEARVLWLGVHANREFLELQQQLALRLRAAGFSMEEREYRPHLTLARQRNPGSMKDLVALGGRKSFGQYSIRELVLFESVLEGGIAKYSAIRRYPVASVGKDLESRL